MLKRIACCACTMAALALTAIARGDEVVLSNGDKVTGKIGTIAGGKMKFTSDSLGDITIELAKVKSFKTDEPAKAKIKGDGFISGKINQGDATTVDLEGHGAMPMDSIKTINPPEEKWTGSIVANGREGQS